jgi:putative alpha-1,2-mannosidase
MTVDGQPYSRNYLDHQLLTRGCDIVFDMSNVADTHRGTAKQDSPYSFSTAR